MSKSGIRVHKHRRKHKENLCILHNDTHGLGWEINLNIVVLLLFAFSMKFHHSNKLNTEYRKIPLNWLNCNRATHKLSWDPSQQYTKKWKKFRLRCLSSKINYAKFTNLLRNFTTHLPRSNWHTEQPINKDSHTRVFCQIMPGVLLLILSSKEVKCYCLHNLFTIRRRKSC